MANEKSKVGFCQNQDVGIGVCDCVCKRESASKAVQVSMVYVNAAKMLYVYEEIYRHPG